MAADINIPVQFTERRWYLRTFDFVCMYVFILQQGNNTHIIPEGQQQLTI